MNKLFKLLTAVLVLVTAGTFSSCKKTFDNPLVQPIRPLWQTHPSGP
ncbi:MAG: hypothetical protein IPI54_02765 [Chitinophagaceae bacterium]|nr:hypothetical protein [Chitinophagaceae bacterium]